MDKKNLILVGSAARIPERLDVALHHLNMNARRKADSPTPKLAKNAICTPLKSLKSNASKEKGKFRF